MAFIALASQKSILSLQKSFLQLNMIGIQNDIQRATAQMAAIQKEYSGQTDIDYEETADYKYWEQMDERLSTEKDSIDTQIAAINEEINGLKTLVNNNIKSSCALNLAGG